MGLESSGEPSLARPFRMTRMHRWGNRLIAPLIRAGLIPHTYLLTTRGRRTGRPHTTPVVLVEGGGRRWLVAPYGAVAWVRNARAAGEVVLRRRGTTVRCAIREVTGAEEAAPVLKQYLSLTGPPRRYFFATKDDPPERFRAEAAAHPVFELTIAD
ncbi:MAG TPA: nitroreductase family deazaflavin-dependent oxidoreductase [Mycobacterium sp.]|nr:nitroreductase family deazaflavin-dependent oxidoreductase [Mycobacterium sp.]